MPFPSPGDLPDPGFELASLLSPAFAGGFFTTSATWEAPIFYLTGLNILKSSLITFTRSQKMSLPSHFENYSQKVSTIKYGKNMHKPLYKA